MGADIKGPYLLIPHSMSGLEAIYWAQNFPNEVSGIVSIDMAVPYSYDGFDFGKLKADAEMGRNIFKTWTLENTRDISAQ